MWTCKIFLVDKNVNATCWTIMLSHNDLSDEQESEKVQLSMSMFGGDVIFGQQVTVDWLAFKEQFNKWHRNYIRVDATLTFYN